MEQGRILERLKEQRKVLDKAIKSLEDAIVSNKKEAIKLKAEKAKPAEVKKVITPPAS